jgi:DNA-binding response OmpR family regulator
MEKKRILLVDDEVTITRTLKLYLEGTGRYEVRTENRGSKALEAAREFKPHLVLLDLIMPDRDGSEVAAELREKADTRNVRVMFLTAMVRPDEVGPGGRIGGYPFVPKPIDPEQVVQRIEEELSR